MKKSFRQPALLALLIIALISCQKTSSFDEPPGSQYPPIFNSQQQAREALSNYFLHAGHGEQLVGIENVLYLESHHKTYALVFYQSSLGHSNILYEQEYQNGSTPSGKTYKCTGESCNCLVQTTISPGGDVSFSCSCSSCTMIINSF